MTQDLTTPLENIYVTRITEHLVAIRVRRKVHKVTSSGAADAYETAETLINLDEAKALAGTLLAAAGDWDGYEAKEDDHGHLTFSPKDRGPKTHPQTW